MSVLIAVERDPDHFTLIYGLACFMAETPLCVDEDQVLVLEPLADLFWAFAVRVVEGVAGCEEDRHGLRVRIVVLTEDWSVSVRELTV